MALGDSGLPVGRMRTKYEPGQGHFNLRRCAQYRSPLSTQISTLSCVFRRLFVHITGCPCERECPAHGASSSALNNDPTNLHGASRGRTDMMCRASAFTMPHTVRSAQLATLWRRTLFPAALHSTHRRIALSGPASGCPPLALRSHKLLSHALHPATKSTSFGSG